MKRHSSQSVARRLRATGAAVALGLLSLGITYALGDAQVARAGMGPDVIVNNRPAPNPNGAAATVSTQGASVDLTGEYFQAQGSNGRSCATCHIPEDAWGINPGTLQRLFRETDGKHPVFNKLDANNPDLLPAEPTTEQLLASYSMLLGRGVFRRGGAPLATRREDGTLVREWDLIAVEDPHGFANLNRLVHWRRVMPTINFPLGSANINWDGGNSVGADAHAGLLNQAGRNISGAQAGPTPAPTPVVQEIVAFEESLFTAQLLVPGAGRLDLDGARGGPEALAGMPRAAGRFDLFDAWAGSANPFRAQIARGQEVFNNKLNTNGVSCNSCHNAVNMGTNVNNLLFDVRVAAPDVRTADMPLYTFRNRLTGETRQLTDAGAGNITGRWRDLGRFKTPTLRALAARAPYFHNGSAATLEGVVRHYEEFLGFGFSPEERADLVAFLNAL
jgi:cytochrome c peroxidase